MEHISQKRYRNNLSRERRGALTSLEQRRALSTTNTIDGFADRQLQNLKKSIRTSQPHHGEQSKHHIQYLAILRQILDNLSDTLIQYEQEQLQSIFDQRSTNK